MVIGIDLGTSNSLVGYYDDGVKLIPNVFGEILTPSVISIDDNNKVLTGKIASKRLVSHPDSTFSVFKRNMGTNKKYIYKNFEYTSTDLSSIILKQLKEDAENYLNTKCEQAIISVPAYFNNKQRQATIDAAKIAGLEVLKLISEPTAAALAHGINEFVDDSIIVVLDLGGGTFDVSILEMFDGVLQVLSIAGDNMLGGEDFTQVIIDDFLNKNNLNKSEFSNQDYSIIYDYCEQIKLNLNNQNNFILNIKNNTYEYIIDEISYQNICSDLLTRMRIPILKALNDAKITTKNINQLILMGGSTKLELIRKYTSLLFDLEPRYDINPDETVAIGVVLSSAIENNIDFENMFLTDVCGFTLGTEITINYNTPMQEVGIFSPIIHRNSTLPVSRVESYTNIGKNNKITFNIYQGESRYAKNNVKLGELKITLPLKEENQEVTLRYTYDISGILEVIATILSTNESFTMIIKDDCSLSEKEIKIKLEKLENIKTHPKDLIEYQLIVAKLEKLFELANDEYKYVIDDAIIKMNVALESQNILRIKKTAKDIETTIQHVENHFNSVFLKKRNDFLN